MSKIIITEEELSNNINSVLKSIGFINPIGTEFIFTTHKVNPLSINDLTKNINIINKNINQIIEKLDDISTVLKVEVNNVYTVIIFKNKFVVKAMYNEHDYCGAAFIIHEESEDIRFNYAFNNKNKIQ